MWVFFRIKRILAIFSFFSFLSLPSFAFPSVQPQTGLREVLIQQLRRGSSFFEVNNGENRQVFALEVSPHYQQLKKEGRLDSLLSSKVDLMGSEEMDQGVYQSKKFIAFHEKQPIFEFSLNFFITEGDDLSDFQIFQNDPESDFSPSFRLKVTRLLNLKSLEFLASLNPELAIEFLRNESRLVNALTWEKPYIHSYAEQLMSEGEALRIHLPMEVYQRQAKREFWNLVQVQCKDYEASQREGLEWMKSNLISIAKYVKENITPEGFRDVPLWVYVKILNQGVLAETTTGGGAGLPLPKTAQDGNLKAFCQQASVHRSIALNI